MLSIFSEQLLKIDSMIQYTSLVISHLKIKSTQVQDAFDY